MNTKDLIAKVKEASENLFRRIGGKSLEHYNIIIKLNPMEEK